MIEQIVTSIKFKWSYINDTHRRLSFISCIKAYGSEVMILWQLYNV